MSSTAKRLIETLEQIDHELHDKLGQTAAEAEAGRLEFETLKALRVTVQRRVEDIERTYNTAAQNAARIRGEYDRLAKLRERASNAMALTPPESPQAPKRAVSAIKDVPRLVQELSAAAVPAKSIQQICGVYFLLHDKEVVYVGQSVAILYRVHQHVVEGKKSFNRWCYIDVKKDQLNEVEQFYITLLRPRLNKAGMPRMLADNDPTLSAEAA